MTRINLGNVKSDVKVAALEGVRAVLTEENSDKVIEMLIARIKPKLPWWARVLPIGTILDKLLPDTLLGVFEDILS